MSGYPKIWTSIMNDPWFVELPAIGRSLFLQLIIIAKLVADTGEIYFKSTPTLAAFCGTDRKTLTRWLDKFERDGKIVIGENSRKSLRLEIVNYNKWQTVSSPREASKMSQSQGKNTSSLPANGTHQLINQPINKRPRRRSAKVQRESSAPADVENALMGGGNSALLNKIANPLKSPAADEENQQPSTGEIEQ